MELIMQTDLEKELPQAIDFNYEAIKAELAGKLEKYKSLVVTEDGIKAAKADRASLNRLRDALDGKRKEVKKQCMSPYTAFEEKVKQLLSMIAEPADAIDRQLKAFEEVKKAEKLARLTEFYQMHVGDLIEILPMEKVLNSKWANTTMPEGSVTQEMADKIVKARNDLKVIEAMKLSCEIQVKEAYLRNLDMSEALAEKARFEEREKALEAARQTAQQTARQDKSSAPPSQPAGSPEIKPPAGPSKTIRAVFYDTTPAFRQEMNALIRAHNIKVEAF